jgi:hypothetical protein
MAKIVVSLSKKNKSHVYVLGVINIQQIMLSECFEGYIMSRYGLYDVVTSGYKFIHYDFIDRARFFYYHLSLVENLVCFFKFLGQKVPNWTRV